MKTVAKINPEKEYENAKKIIDLASKAALSNENTDSLSSSVDNLITAARVLMEREDRRRGAKHPIKSDKKLNDKRNNSSNDKNNNSKKKDTIKLPSEKFPELTIEEKTISREELPTSPYCNETMSESGLYNTNETLEVDPKRYYIQRTKREKYTCKKCHGSMLNTPTKPRIVPSSNYGDSIIIDVTLSKFCDLIPIERYSAIASRSGIKGLPPQSLIGLTNHLAVFLKKVLAKIKAEAQSSWTLQADETPHKMLEGDDKKNWYLWGFFSSKGCYFEACNTRSGDVAYNFLIDSKAKYLVTDGYTGYKKAIKQIYDKNKRKILNIFCNSHSFRYFRDANNNWHNEVEFFLHTYGEIYRLEEIVNSLTNDNEKLAKRKEMQPLFEKMKKRAIELQEGVMPESLLKKSINYFLNHYEGLTVCTSNIDIPLDNNLSEREMRSPVVGRKTWIGTHSKRGAKTMSTHFSIIHSCKMVGINPRDYYPWIVQRIHDKKDILTPYEYSQLSDTG